MNMDLGLIAKSKSRLLARRYQDALRQHLLDGREGNLALAGNLGCQAAEIGLETLDLAQIHQQALSVQALPSRNTADNIGIMKQAAAFFAEAILPIEATHRMALEPNAQLNQVNQELRKRSIELASVKGKLKNAIVRRKRIDADLREKEMNSARLMDKSQLLQEQLRHLSRQVLLVQEDERKRISRELHDVIAQMLAGINICLESLRTDAAVNTENLSKSILRTQRLVERSVDIVHQFARSLRPAMLDDLGLIPPLYAYMKKFTTRTGIHVSLTAFAEVEELGNPQRTTLYRVAQEALTNIARHAKASSGQVIIEKVGTNVRMQIKDNGKAFDVEQVLHARKIRRLGLGLLGMRERLEMIGGAFSVQSVAGLDTTIQAEIPFAGGTGQ